MIEVPSGQECYAASTPGSLRGRLLTGARLRLARVLVAALRGPPRDCREVTLRDSGLFMIEGVIESEAAGLEE